MKLVPYREEDLDLTATLETDPRVMSHLGGPATPEGAWAVHQKRLASEGGRYFTVFPDDAERPVGLVAILRSVIDGEEVHDVGVMLLPEHQGQRMSLAAGLAAIDLVRREGELSRLHAFCGVNNLPSNALASRAGFRLIGQRDIEYEGRLLRCNHWVLDLSA